MPDLTAADLDAAVRTIARQRALDGRDRGGGEDEQAPETQASLGEAARAQQELPLLDALKDHPSRRRVAKFDEAVRRAIQSGHRREEIRPDRAWIGRASGRNGQKIRIAVFAPRRQGPGGEGRRGDIVGMEDLAESVKAREAGFRRRDRQSPTRCAGRGRTWVRS